MVDLNHSHVNVDHFGFPGLYFQASPASVPGSPRSSRAAPAADSAAAPGSARNSASLWRRSGTRTWVGAGRSPASQKKRWNHQRKPRLEHGGFLEVCEIIILRIINDDLVGGGLLVWSQWCLLVHTPYISIDTSTLAGWWWFLPLWKIWVRRLGWWLFPIYGKIKFMIQTTN